MDSLAKRKITRKETEAIFNKVCTCLKMVDKYSAVTKGKVEDAVYDLVKNNMIITSMKDENGLGVYDYAALGKFKSIMSLTRTCENGLFRSDYEEELFDKARAGDKFAEYDFIEGNLPLVEFLAERHLNIADFDELYSAGAFGLMCAYRSFDKARGIKFSAFAGLSIKHEMFKYYKKTKRINNPIGKECSLFDPIVEFKSGHTWTLMDILEDEDVDLFKGLYQKDVSEKVKRVLAKKLTQTQREIIEKLYGLKNEDAKSVAELAAERNVSAHNIYNIQSAGFKKLKTALAGMYENMEK